MNNQLIKIPFHQDALVTIMHNSNPCVAVKPICDSLGIDWEGQRQRIRRDEVLDTCAFIIKVQLPDDDQHRDNLFLPINMLQGWMFGISISRVKPKLRPKLIQFKRECYQVLHDYFTKGEAVNPRKTGRNQRQPERPKAPDYRYNITLCYRDNVTGLEGRFSGRCNTPEEIVQGTARRFGMFIPELMTMPFNAY